MPLSTGEFSLNCFWPKAWCSPAEDGSMQMGDRALRVYFREWGKTLAEFTLRQALRAQIDQLARAFEGREAEVRPWRWSTR